MTLSTLDLMLMSLNKCRPRGQSLSFPPTRLYILVKTFSIYDKKLKDIVSIPRKTTNK